MKTYTVAVPMTGVIYVNVEADTDAEAIEKALQSEDLKLDNVEEWEYHKKVVQGNVFHGVQREIEVLEVTNENGVTE